MARMRCALTLDGAEAQLLLAELCHFIGRAVDREFIASCLDVRRYRRHGFGARVFPTAMLERALDALWRAAPTG